MKVQYKDLSKPLKVVVILSWIFAVINCLYFIVGLIQGIIIGIGA